MTLKESESVLASDRYWKTIDLKRLQCMLCKTGTGILPSLQKSSSALFLVYPLPHDLDVYCSVSADGVGQGLSGSVGADDVETLSPSHVGLMWGRQLPPLLLETFSPSPQLTAEAPPPTHCQGEGSENWDVDRPRHFLPCETWHRLHAAEQHGEKASQCWPVGRVIVRSQVSCYHCAH